MKKHAAVFWLARWGLWPGKLPLPEPRPRLWSPWRHDRTKHSLDSRPRCCRAAGSGSAWPRHRWPACPWGSSTRTQRLHFAMIREIGDLGHQPHNLFSLKVAGRLVKRPVLVRTNDGHGARVLRSNHSPMYHRYMYVILVLLCWLDMGSSIHWLYTLTMIDDTSLIIWYPTFTFQVSKSAKC